MRKILIIVFIFTLGFSKAQEKYEFTVIEEAEEMPINNTSQLLDTTYTKNLSYSEERKFKEDLNTKYSERAFTYVDDLKESKTEPKLETKPERKTTPKVSFSGFSFFMSSIFPFILGLVVVLIILKSFVNIEPGFWNLKAAKKEKTKKLVSEEENIDESDYDALLLRAIQNNDYRLATRYYYLALLKKLSQKNHIEYHKDKTNSEYLFELKNKTMRSNFSYLSYIYSYVWYGEFSVDKMKFSVIEKKYKSFIETIK